MSQSEQPSRLSLGAGLLGAPAAEGYGVPNGEVPGPWVTAQLDPAQLLAVFQACRAGRDLVLQTAPRAHLTLRIRPDSPRLITQLRAAARALETRGLQPVKLTLEFQYKGSKRRCEMARQQVAAFLQTAGSRITELELQTRGYEIEPGFLDSLVSESASALSNVHSLKIGADTISVVPLAPLLPNLTTIKYSQLPDYLEEHQSFTASAAARALQVSRIEYWDEFYWDFEGAEKIALLLPAPGTISTTLTELRLGVWLTDELLRVLVNRCPALKSLAVAGMCGGCGEASWAREWAVERFSIKYPNTNYYSHDLEFDAPEMACNGLGRLAALPRRAGGERMWVETPSTVVLHACSQGFPPGILAALERCTFDVELIEVFPAEHLAARDEPAALRVMLGQLSALHAPDAQVQLCGVRKTEELAAVVDDCMPALQHLDWLPVSWYRSLWDRH